MPELPDLEVISKNLNKQFSKKKVISLNIFKESKLNATVADFTDNIVGQTLESITRNGKELLLSFSNNQFLGIHLMLKGQIHLLSEPNVKHKIFELVFDSVDSDSLFQEHQGFSVTDYMVLAKPILNPVVPAVPDALSESFNSIYLQNVLKKSRAKNIKDILRDQSKVRGIGNAYIDEILWESRVSPISVGSKIPEEYVNKVVEATQKVLKNAIDEIKKINPDIISGEERSFLKIHNPNKDKSPNGFKIEVIEYKNRKTYFTDEQKIFK